jgi:VanZ family protein
MADVSISLMATRRLVIAANLIYAVALLVVGLIPSIPEAVAGVSDHLAHAMAYAVQAVLLYGLFLRSCGRGRAAVLAIGVAVLYGGFVEMLQSLQPTRTVEAADLVANTVGAAAATVIVYIVTGTRATDIRR